MLICCNGGGSSEDRTFVVTAFALIASEVVDTGSLAGGFSSLTIGISLLTVTILASDLGLLCIGSAALLFGTSPIFLFVLFFAIWGSESLGLLS